ncbi:MAG: molybdenum cofactor biosynthesis protein MoaE [Planctomycetota bacterium]
MNTIKLVREPIDPSDWAGCLDGADCGAQLWFSGVTRQKTFGDDGRLIVTRTLYYEAYETMALKQLEELALVSAQSFNLVRTVIIHRLGEVPLGQSSVLVGGASAHRSNVFEAIPWIMDRLKADVPIWKRETLDDSSMHWVHP